MNRLSSHCMAFGASVCISFGCGSKSSKLPPEPLTIQHQVVSEEDIKFQDLEFDLEQQAGTFLARTQRNGTLLAFRIRMGPRWPAQTVGDESPLKVFTGSLEVESVGAASDALVQTIDSIWQVKSGARRMKPREEFNAIAIEGDPNHLERGLVRIKLFFEPPAEADYAEFYFNFDLPKRKLSFLEKETDYRPMVVKAFAAPYGSGPG